MKKISVFLILFFFAVSFTFSQTAQSEAASAGTAVSLVPQMDESVKNLARDIHAKLVEKNAAKIAIGQFTFQNGTPTFSTYWINQLINELVNMPRRNYIILSGAAADADWTISGEMVLVVDIIRVYSRLIRTSDRAIEGSFFSNFARNEQINTMLAFVGAGSAASSSGGFDMYEPDSWEMPVTYAIGSNSSIPVMNRTIEPGGDEDFFLLVPERDGRLTMETTGNIDTFMTFFNYDTSEELSSDDDSGQGSNARINYNVRGGTRYLAVVRGYSSSTTGSYGFRAFMLIREGSNSWENPISYEIGTDDSAVTINRTLQEGDEDYFLLVPQRDGRLTMETTGRTDTYMEFYEAETRELLDENDDGGTNYNARIRYNVRAGVQYIALVRGYGNSTRGSYGFRAFMAGSSTLAPDEYEPDDEPSQAKPIQIGETQNRTFHSGDDVDWVTFTVTTAGRYIIDAKGVNNNRLDTYLELFDSNLNLIAEDDDGGDNLSARLSLNLNAGTYYIKVWCLDEEPDQGYTLSVTN